MIQQNTSGSKQNIVPGGSLKYYRSAPEMDCQYGVNMGSDGTRSVASLSEL